MASLFVKYHIQNILCIKNKNKKHLINIPNKKIPFINIWKYFKVYLVVAFENCSGKPFLRIVFSVLKKNYVWELILENVFVLKKKTCLVELIKKFFKTSKTKKCVWKLFFFQLKCFLQLTLYYKYINNFYMYNSFKLKKLFHFENFTPVIIFLNKGWLVIMCNYINFNNICICTYSKLHNHFDNIYFYHKCIILIHVY